MRTLIVLTVAAALWIIPDINSAQAQALVIGIGNLSCANWLQSPEFKLIGQDWIGGYWSGLNAGMGFRGNDGLKYPGIRSDAPAIFGEVEKICVAEPSTKLIEAVDRVYLQFVKDGK